MISYKQVKRVGSVGVALIFGALVLWGRPIAGPGIPPPPFEAPGNSKGKGIKLPPLKPDSAAQKVVP